MKKYLSVVSLLAVHLILLSGLRFTAWPEMFAYPYLVSKGFLLYQDIIHPYPPLLTFLLALVFKTVGFSLVSLKAVAWVLILAADVAVYLTVEKFTKNKASALFSLAVFVFLQPFFEGNMLWFDIGLVPFVLWGLYYIFEKKDSKAGFFLALAALVKQTGIIFIGVNLIYLIAKEKDLKRAVSFLLFPVFFLTVFLLALLVSGTLRDFWSWALVYPLSIWSKLPSYVDMELTGGRLLPVALLGLPVFLLSFVYPKKGKRKELFLLFLFLIAGLLAVYPRFSLFHFQSALGVLAVLVGVLSARLKTKYFLAAFVAVIYFFSLHRGIIARDWGGEARFFGTEEKQISEKIKEKVNQDESVFLLGVHSGNYVFSERLPAKPWADNFVWYYEIPGFQEKVIEAWRQDPPYFILVKEKEAGNWYDLGVYRPVAITEWIKQNYQEIDKINDLTLFKRI